MAFDFPSSPTENQLYAPAGGPTYKYVAPGWRVVDSGTYVPPPAGTAYSAVFAPGVYINDETTARQWVSAPGVYVN